MSEDQAWGLGAGRESQAGPVEGSGLASSSVSTCPSVCLRLQPAPQRPLGALCAVSAAHEGSRQPPL